MTTEQREAIVKEAKEWVGTKYRPYSRLKGAGCDCAQFIAGVYENTGHISTEDLRINIPQVYSVNAGQHIETTEYVDKLSQYMREIPESEVKPGDVVMYKLDKAFAHSAIVIEWPTFIIHALARHGVHGAHGTNEAILHSKPRRFFTLKEK
jgi:cell wall-associated NlpC family hydrolase